ncbi:ankyrin repeat containing protein [Diplodia corticola]|uniref:Ankyrin repeat containing protein n=1 Tax=Diplodia corticola TaxID=236234 RepID=A0A1J9RYQ3_9PEZI|nr:ankyrin repeat containing protein [Diplodia corticola]OJD32940.1 ankyrin repeat containing protein [Diplodia corticola]
MAEVVGLIASVATLVEVALKLEKLASKLRDVPDELLALSNELAELRFLFTDIERVIRRDPTSQARFSRTLDEADRRIKNLDSFLQKVDAMNARLVDWINWLRYRPKICRLQSELRDARLQITALLGVENLSALQRVERLVQSVQVTVSTSAQMIQHTHETVLTNTSLLAPLSGQDQTQALASTASASHGAVALKCHVDPPRKTACKCTCHRKPQRLSLSNRFLGSLFIGYSNIPLLSARCSERVCQDTCKNWSTEASVTYYFPASVMNKVLNVAIASSSFSGPTFSLTLWNTIPRDSLWFQYAGGGNIEGLKSLLESGSARLTDVDEFGNTALIKALVKDQFCVCEWLLQAGIDPFHADVFGTSFMEILLIFYLNNPSHTNTRNILYIITASPEEELQLPEIHKAILSKSSQSLSECILERGSNINATDAHGRTALWWAASLDNSEAVKTLLENGADPNIKDTVFGLNALLSAIFMEGFSFDILHLLIRHGTDVSAVSNQKDTVLYYLCYKFAKYLWSDEHHDGMLRIAKDCLRLGCPLDSQNFLGTTAIAKATYDSNHHAVKFLLDCGANYTIRENDGDSILHLAAYQPDVATLNVLAAHGLRGIDISLKNRRGETALDIFESWKADLTREEIKAFYRLWGKLSIRARGASRAGFVAGPVDAPGDGGDFVKQEQQEEEYDERTAEACTEEEDDSSNDSGSEDEDEYEDLFVDALEG